MKANKIIAIVLVMCFAFISASCSKKDGTGVIFRYALSQDPQNLDPQLSTDMSSLTIIENLYEGLMKKGPKGTIENGVAESYTVSEDGLKYTFKLRQNAFWAGNKNFKQQVTAKDFVFAFRRLIDPKTYSPYSDKYFCIKNSQQINQGKLPVDQLGVSSNSDFELVIELQYSNPEFLTLLAESSSAPCNEDYFYSTKGKYGLESTFVIANGAFYLNQWLFDPYGKDNYLILKKNKFYNEYSPVCPSGLNYFIVRDKDSILSNFKKDQYECIVDDGTNKALFDKKYKASEYENMSSGIVFNLSNPLLQNNAVRQALALSIDRNISESELTKGIRTAGGIVPNGVTLLNKSFRELASEPTVGKYNKSLAQFLWTSSLTQTQKNLLNSYKIIVPKSYKNSEYLDYITTQWQDVLELSCSIEVLPDEDFKKRIATGDYNMALCEIKGDHNSPDAFLSAFKTNNKNNTFKFSNSQYDAILNKINTTSKLSDCITFYSEAEKYLIDNYYYIPAFYQKEYLISDKKVSGIIYDPFTKQIDFRNSKKN